LRDLGVRQDVHADQVTGGLSLGFLDSDPFALLDTFHASFLAFFLDTALFPLLRPLFDTFSQHVVYLL
jgi:hypothetical protein